MIRILPEEVANKIAAGEVVERPASVVKELVENSLDAGATEIEISVKYGGLSLIRVSDNGSGMSAEDARASVVRYATSKIQSVEDIFRINTFGFRGEALPSIAAVSRFRLMTRMKGEPAGIEIEIEGGKIARQAEAALREGTVVEVRDLFFNTPARRKFLKSERTELARIAEMLTHLALAHPAVRFILVSDGENLLDVACARDLRTRIRSLYDAEFESRLVDVLGDLPGVRISGLVGKPELARPHRRDQIFFVNQRPIKSPALGFALTQAFHGLVMNGRHPVGMIFLDVNPELVDVNVHPTKREVRLSNERAIQSFLAETVRRQVLGQDLFPEVMVGAGLVPARAPTGGAPTPELRLREPEACDYAASTFQEHLDEIRILGQFHASFLVGECSEGLVIVDQHAAHERVQFEAVLRSLEEGRIESQGLLVPVIVKLTAQEEPLFKEALKLLEKVGFAIEPFGPRTYAVQSVPPFMGEGDVESFIKDYLARWENVPESLPAGERQRDMAALIACKSRSVKAGDRLTMEEMEALVKALRTSASPFTCPHGRPTLLKITFNDFEKHFKRT